MANDVLTAATGIGPIVDTVSGKCRGSLGNGIHAFKSVPYGASTAGHNRFWPPQPPTAWSGVREALAYVGRAWQLPGRPARRPALETLLGRAGNRGLPDSEICGRRVSATAACGRSWSGSMAAPSPMARVTAP